MTLEEVNGFVVDGQPTEPPLRTGETVFVDLPEHGISAEFLIADILPCPTPAVGPGQLVTTKFIHENAEVFDLRLDGSNDVIGTTASHPFWSEDWQEFVSVGELRVGETLLLADGSTRQVASLTLRPQRETVYNIEVDAEHVYYVGHDGVLVHNECEGRHHMFPRYLGSRVRHGHSMLTRLSAAEHTHLHRAMRQWLKQHYPDLMHGPGRGRSHMVGTFTLKSRIRAVREFYGQYRNPLSTKDSHSMFEIELRRSLKAGLLE